MRNVINNIMLRGRVHHLDTSFFYSAYARASDACVCSLKYEAIKFCILLYACWQDTRTRIKRNCCCVIRRRKGALKRHSSVRQRTAHTHTNNYSMENCMRILYIRPLRSVGSRRAAPPRRVLVETLAFMRAQFLQYHF